MSGVLILSVSAGQLAGPSDEAGQQVAQALLAHGLSVASRPVGDEGEPAGEGGRGAGGGACGLIVILGGGGGSAGEIVRRVLARVTGARLILNERLLATLEAVHARRERPMPRPEERPGPPPPGGG